MVISINGRKHWLWRAVDQDGYVLDEIVQSRRNTKAARRLLKRLLKKQDMAPKRMITDKLRSYGAARRQFMAHVEHRSHKGLNNRAENSHVPLRKRERVMQGFRSPGSLQRFVSIFSAVRNLFVPPPHKPVRISNSIASPRRHGRVENHDRNTRLKTQITASIHSFANKVTTPVADIKMTINNLSLNFRPVQAYILREKCSGHILGRAAIGLCAVDRLPRRDCTDMPVHAVLLIPHRSVDAAIGTDEHA